MCDSECRKRFEAIEIDIAEIATDMKWTKHIIEICGVIFCTAIGADVTGVI